MKIPETYADGSLAIGRAGYTQSYPDLPGESFVQSDGYLIIKTGSAKTIKQLIIENAF